MSAKTEVFLGDYPDHVVQRIVAHARPDVFWLASPEYMRAWAALTGDTSMTEAAWTAPTSPNPEFVNIQLAPTGGSMLLTVRGPNTGTAGGGETTQIPIPLDAWDQLMSDAQQVRQRAG